MQIAMTIPLPLPCWARGGGFAGRADRRAAFTLVELLVVTALVGGILTVTLAALCAGLARRVRSVQDEWTEQRSVRASIELREALLGAANVAVFISRAASSNASASAIAGNFLRVEGAAGDGAVGFENLPDGGSGAGAIVLHRPGQAPYTVVSGVGLEAGGTWVSLTNGLPEARWTVATPVERIVFAVATTPRRWR